MYIIFLPCFSLYIGADLCAGSLIKNLGGTLALTGGYIAGRGDLVAAARVHLSAPGVEGGASLNQYRTMYQVNVYFFTVYQLLCLLFMMYKYTYLCTGIILCAFCCGGVDQGRRAAG